MVPRPVNRVKLPKLRAALMAASAADSSSPRRMATSMLAASGVRRAMALGPPFRPGFFAERRQAQIVRDGRV